MGRRPFSAGRSYRLERPGDYLIAILMLSVTSAIARDADDSTLPGRRETPRLQDAANPKEPESNDLLRER